MLPYRCYQPNEKKHNTQNETGLIEQEHHASLLIDIVRAVVYVNAQISH